MKLWDPEKQNVVLHTPSTIPVASAGQELKLTGIADLDGDDRLDVISMAPDGRVFCHRLANTISWNIPGMIPPHVPDAYRTGQYDNYEPNDGALADATGLPAPWMPIPSALTSSGDFYSYLSHDGDVDTFEIDTAYSGALCLTSPAGLVYDLHVFSTTVDAQGQAAGLIHSDTSDAPIKCFEAPQAHKGEYGYRVQITPGSSGETSRFAPYWLRAEL